MNQYLITYQGQYFATNADNIMEAEDKFIDNENELYGGGEFSIEVIEDLKNFEDKDLITYF